MRGTLRVGLSDTPIAREHRRLLETALRRGKALPEEAIAQGLSREYPAALLAAAREGWRQRMAHEHRSSTVFSQLLPQLIAAGTDLDMKTCVLRMAMDELRHAGLCGAVIEALGGRAEIEVDLTTTPLPTHEDSSPRVAALRNVFFVCCLSETVAISVMAHELELIEEPVLRLAVEQLSADESLHGRFGWLYLGQVWPSLTDDEREAFVRYLPVAFAFFERDLLSSVPEIAYEGREVGDALWSLGVRDAASTRELMYATIEEVIAPRLEELGVPARAAWEERAQGAGVG
ncbi:MAG: ferritin-like domain-containing protein [Sandaracinaceae bacterium]